MERSKFATESSHTGWKPIDALAVQKDVYSSLTNHLAHRIVNAYDRLEAAAAGTARCRCAVRSWNGQMEKQTAAPLQFVTLAYDQLKELAVKSAWSGPTDVYQFMMAPATMQNIVDSNGGLFSRYQPDAGGRASGGGRKADARQRAGALDTGGTCRSLSSILWEANCRWWEQYGTVVTVV